MDFNWPDESLSLLCFSKFLSDCEQDTKEDGEHPMCALRVDKNRQMRSLKDRGKNNEIALRQDNGNPTQRVGAGQVLK